jgi:glycosyltransferase involved in cell wall biosynthesis
MANLFERLVKQYNYNVTLITGAADNGFHETYDDVFNIIDLRIYDRGKLPHQQPSKVPVFLSRARRVITKMKTAEILHFNNHIPNILPYFLVSSIPKICTIYHLENFSDLDGFLPRILLPVVQDSLETNSPCTLVHVTSRYTARCVARYRILARKRIVVIPCGIDISKYLLVKRKPEPGTFLMIGRLESRKHYEHAILAVKLAKKLRKDLKLYIVGDGPLRSLLESKTKTENLDSTVRFLGNVTEQEKLELLSCAEALIHLGYPEGFGIAIIEALATGTPVIAYDLPPINEIIKNNIHGVFINKDNIIQLVKILIHFNSEDYSEVSLRAKAMEYDLGKVVKSFHQLYNSLLK